MTQFSQALLADLGASPTNANDLATLQGWYQAEGGAGPQWAPGSNNTDSYNPLNTTQPAPGAVSTNSAGVKAYTSWDQGLQATFDTLTNGSYAAIVADLKAGAPTPQTAADVGASPWGTPNFAPGGTATPAGAGTAGASTTGVNLNPFAIPGEIWGGISKAGGGAIASGILGVVDTITKPLVHFLQDAVLILFGIVIFIVAAVLIAHGVSHSSPPSLQSSTPAPNPGGSSSGEKTAGKAAPEEGAAEDAGEAAAVAA